jgi:hypothetical protein
MNVKRLQYYASINTGNVVRVTKVIRPDTVTRKNDLCMVKDVVNDKIVDSSARYILSDSLRRKYYEI